jgi:hypothetical protein
MQDVSRQHVIDRVAAGVEAELVAIEKLKKAGWKVTPSTSKQDRIDKIDCYLNNEPAQIKTRATGDDIIIEVYRPYYGADAEGTQNGRDTKGSYTMYVLSGRYGENPKVYRRKDISNKITELLKEWISADRPLEQGRSAWYRSKDASICIKEDNRDSVLKMLVYVKTDSLTEIHPNENIVSKS